jgi:hypothetical protein
MCRRWLKGGVKNGLTPGRDGRGCEPDLLRAQVQPVVEQENTPDRVASNHLAYHGNAANLLFCGLWALLMNRREALRSPEQAWGRGQVNGSLCPRWEL